MNNRFVIEVTPSDEVIESIKSLGEAKKRFDAKKAEQKRIKSVGGGASKTFVASTESALSKIFFRD